MQQYRCIDYFKNKSNVIVGYRLELEDGSKQMDVSAEKLIRAVESNACVVSNLVIMNGKVQFVKEDKSLDGFNKQEYIKTAEEFRDFLKQTGCLPGLYNKVSGVHRIGSSELSFKSYTLGNWAATQRAQLIKGYKGTKLQDLKIKLLDSICPEILHPENVREQLKDQAWVNRLDKFVLSLQNCNIDSGDSHELSWIRYQIQAAKEGRLSEDKVELIKQVSPKLLTMPINAKSLMQLSDELYGTGEIYRQWIKEYEAVSNVVPKKVIEADSIEFNWIITQINNYELLSPGRKGKFNKLMHNIYKGIANGKITAHSYKVLVEMFYSRYS